MSQLVLDLSQAMNIFGLTNAVQNSMLTRAKIETLGKPLAVYLDNGVTIAAMKRLGFTTSDLLRGGMAWHHLRMPGNTISEIDGVTPQDLFAAGWTMQQASAMKPSLTQAELVRLGLTCDVMIRFGGLDATAVMNMDGVTLPAWRELGMTLNHLRMLGMNSDHFLQMKGWTAEPFMHSFGINAEAAAEFRAPEYAAEEEEGRGGVGVYLPPLPPLPHHAYEPMPMPIPRAMYYDATPLSEAARRVLAHMSATQQPQQE